MLKNVFDTNILIDYLNGVESSIREVEGTKHKIISIITWMEVLIGASNKSEQELIKNFLSNFKIVDVNQEIGEIAIDVRQKHKMKLPDAIILATAIQIGAILVTRNTKDFSNVMSHIKVPYTL